MFFFWPSAVISHPLTFSLANSRQFLGSPLSPRIPPVAWVAICIIILFTLAVNIAMIALLRAKTRPDQLKRQPKPGGFIGVAQNLSKMGEVIRDPLARERSQLDELSKLVHNLDKNALQDQPDNDKEHQEKTRGEE